MKSLRTLVGFSLPMSSSKNIEDLGNLKNLVDLCLDCRIGGMDDHQTSTVTWIAALHSSLVKLRNLKCLYVSSFLVSYCADPLSSFAPPFRNLKLLHLSGCTFSKVPRWIGDLHNLHSLRIGVKEVPKFSCQDVGIIGKLPCLIHLQLRISCVLTERLLIGGSTGFSVLKNFLLECDGVSYLTFEAGAMPQLQALWLGLDSNEWDKATPVGMEHLSSLKKITIQTVYSHSTETAEVADDMCRQIFHQVAHTLPSRPTVNFLEGCLLR